MAPVKGECWVQTLAGLCKEIRLFRALSTEAEFLEEVEEEEEAWSERI